MSEIGFDDFKRLALKKNLSKFERINFPDSYRKDTEDLILLDIFEKCPLIKKPLKTILDIGPGCSNLPLKIISNALKLDQNLILIDSSEMLDQLTDHKNITKISSRFPECPSFIKKYQKRIDVIVCYSVFQYIFNEGNIFNFLDSSLSLLSTGGQMLIGDIPNISKRKRFLSSKKGKEFHKNYTKSDQDPQIIYNQIDHDSIDDSIIFSILNRSRNQGFDAYVLPQKDGLCMSNRREDILITRP